MARYLVAYIATAVVFLGMDAVWLTVSAKTLYRPLLGELLRENFVLAPAIAFYLLYVGGIVFFAVTPGLAGGRWTTALLRGAVLGLIAYATYDLTNQATLKIWSSTITFADMAWGAFATGVAASLGTIITQAIVKSPSAG